MGGKGVVGGGETEKSSVGRWPCLGSVAARDADFARFAPAIMSAPVPAGALRMPGGECIGGSCSRQPADGHESLILDGRCPFYSPGVIQSPFTEDTPVLHCLIHAMNLVRVGQSS